MAAPATVIRCNASHHSAGFKGGRCRISKRDHPRPPPRYVVGSTARLNIYLTSSELISGQYPARTARSTR